MIEELVYDTTMIAKNTMMRKVTITKNAMKISWITAMLKRRLHPQLQMLIQKYGNYLQAINVAKFAHLNSTSQLENPLFLAISIFSIIV